MHINRTWLALFTATLILATLIGCGQKESPNSISPVVQNSEGTGISNVGPPSEATEIPLVEPSSILAENQEAWFSDGVTYYDGSDKFDSLEGGNTPAFFKKDPSRPYGFYILETMKETKLEKSFSWGTDDMRAELSLLDADDVSLETNYINSMLAKYTEYAGTHKDGGTYNDYLVLIDHGHRLVIRLRYLEEDMATVLPDLIASARSLRYVADPAAFKPGMEIEFPQGENEEEAEIYQRVQRNLEAIEAKDKSAFRDTLQTSDKDYLDYLLDQETQYRFTKLTSPISYLREATRADVGIEYEYLSQEIVHLARYTISLLKDKEDRWYIANID